MRRTAYLALPLLVLLAAPAYAQYDQTVVIGLGIGVHTYAESDDVREGSALFGDSDEIKAGGLSQLYLEWYAFGPLALGLRSMSIGSGRTYTLLDKELKQTVNVGASLITATWVPVRWADNYARLGLVFGAGGATYEVTQTYTDGSNHANDYEITESTSGTAGLAGAYIDWGGEGFGARFGMNSLTTALDDLSVENSSGGTTNLSVDGSGTSFYFDLRWAF